MSQQLLDDGAVIGYRPKLEYNKTINNNNASISSSKYTDASGTVQYSNTLSGLISNPPSATISDVDYVAANIKSLINNLSDKFEEGEWGEYSNISTLLNAVSIGDTEYINEFIAAHKHNITGSIVPELIGHLYSVLQRVEVLSDTLKELYYGAKNITQEEMDEKDSINIEKLKKLESTSQEYKINYVSLSYDSTLNRSISTEVFAINKRAIKMSKVPGVSKHITDDAKNKELIVQLYEEVNNDLDYRQEAFEIQQTVEIMEKTLYNYYNSRNDYINLYNIYDGQENFGMSHRLYDYQYRLKRSLENVVRALESNQHYLSQMTSLEQEKRNLMGNYENLNYKY